MTFTSIIEEFGDRLGHYWALVLLISAVISTIYRFVKRLMAQAVKQIEEIIETKIAPIRAEVTTNSGGSMKDAVKRLEEGQGSINGRLDDSNVTLKCLSAQASKNEGRLQAVTTNLPAAYYEMDVLGNITQVNDSYLALFQLTEHEALNSQEWRKHISEEDLAQIDRSGAQSMESHMDWYCTFTVKRNGVGIPVVARAKAIFLNDEFNGFSGAMTYNLGLLR
jgi:PAS domain S-box-containing protein